MKKLFKRSVSVFLTLLMLFQLAPYMAYAVNDVSDSSANESVVEYSADNALGNMILNSSGEELTADKKYKVDSVVMYGSVANATVTVKAEATLVVAIYDEEGIDMLASGKTTVAPEAYSSSTAVSVYLDIDEMPEYFYLRAFLLDANNLPLSEVYENMEYTQKFEQFAEKTTDDFDEEKVLNLDESKSDNFLVVVDDAVVVEPDGEDNIVVTDDFMNGFYVIENATDDIKNLQSGEILYYEYGEGDDEYIIAKVDTVKVNGDTVEITASEPEDLTDFFQYAKVDMESSDSSFDEETMSSEVAHEAYDRTPATRDVNINSKVVRQHYWSANFKLGEDGHLDFAINSVISFNFKVYIDFYIFGVRSAYIEATVGYDSTFDVELTGDAVKMEIPLGIIGIGTGAGVSVSVKFLFVVESEIQLSVSFAIVDSKLGFAYRKGKGFYTISNFSFEGFDIDIGNKTTLFIGLKAEASLKLTKHVTGSLEFKAGAQLEGTIGYGDHFEYVNLRGEKIDARHNCSHCMDIDIGLKIEGSAKIKFFKVINTGGKLSWFFKFADAYFSADYGFGFGVCPWVEYKVKVIVTDALGNPAANVLVNNEAKTNLAGEAEIYLPKGTSVINAVSHINNTGTATVTFSPENDDPVFRLTLENTSGVLISMVTDIQPGHNRFTWTLYNNGELLIEGIGKLRYMPFSYSTVEKVKRVSIGKGATVLGTDALSGMYYATEIALPESVVEIENNFGSLSYIPNVNYWIREAIDNLEKNSSPEDYLRIRIPAGVEKIGENAFDYVYASFFEVDENNKYFSSDKNGALYNKDKTELIRYPSYSFADEYIMPQSVTKIRDEAFEIVAFLDRLVISDNVSGKLDLFATVDLSSLEIGSGITEVEMNICYGLDKLTVPSNVETFTMIESDITSIEFENGVKSISFGYEFKNLSKIKIHESVESISWNANFYNVIEVEYCGESDRWDNVKHYNKPDNLIVYRSYFVTPVGFSLKRSTNNISIENAVPGFSYVVMVVRDDTAEDLLSSENLIYINQKKATETSLVFEWNPPENVENYKVIITDRNVDDPEHNHTMVESDVTEPTCCSEGYTTYICECGRTTFGNYVDKTEHNLTGVDIVTESTCTEDGAAHICCLDCDYYIEGIIFASGHEYTAAEVVESYCGAEGYTVYRCFCGHEYKGDFTEKDEHSFTADGTCYVCGFRQEKEEEDKECSHLCHSNGVAGMIYKMLRVFWRFFDINKVCSCGTEHY